MKKMFPKVDMSGHEINLPVLKQDLLNELKPLMKECVEGWLNNQKDTLLLQLIGMIEQDKWQKSHQGTMLEPSKPIPPEDLNHNAPPLTRTQSTNIRTTE